MLLRDKRGQEMVQAFRRLLNDQPWQLMYSQVQKTKEECEHRTMKEQILESQSVTL